MTDMNFFKNNSSQFIKKHGQLEWFIKTANQKPNIVKQNNSTLNQIHERANKMVFYESKFSKLFENYKKQKQNLGNLRKSKNTLDVLVKKAIDDENKGKGTRAETLKEIQEQLPGSLDILGYVNNQKIREKEYILENHVKQYAKKWQKSHFPMSNNERQKQGLPKISYTPKLNVIKRNYSCKGKKDGWVY
ncbi:hypothetical protein PPERSA_09583 [Pseudocohnilembus persalinus]|uniref:Uncharacterized protein n=1 Tax=Pseudocohnilembus persalinus TaxID=266149 RepID=A0A0V0QFJ2_PSEPJ|nr:hypothetical protein PPERSA_09583 [Pseudocohnilembus persalinus]|eukprot:KRX00977.1 hypothetical protein PPERSA_09583 [Pseudocohnilembus persalinus]